MFNLFLFVDVLRTYQIATKANGGIDPISVVEKNYRIYRRIVRIQCEAFER